MKITQVDHVGIAVKDLDKAIDFWGKLLQLGEAEREIVEEQKVSVGMLKCGETRIELLESTTPDGPIGRFIERSGEGMQQLAIRVDNIEEVIKHLMDNGVRMIDETPKIGAGGIRMAFVHPKSTGGVLVELTERHE